MCVLRAYINKFIFEKILLKIEKVIKTFSISDNFFSKLIYYCVPDTKIPLSNQNLLSHLITSTTF